MSEENSSVIHNVSLGNIAIEDLNVGMDVSDISLNDDELMNTIKDSYIEFD